MTSVTPENPSVDPQGPGSPANAGPLTQPIATVPVTTKYYVGLALAQFGLFVALLSPVMVSMQLKANQLAPENPAALIGAVLPVGALGALFANPLAGALSDRTRTRFGRRRPWLVGGIVLFAIALAWVAFAPDQLNLTLAWLLAQIAANGTFAALTASFADNVPQLQRGKASSIIAVAQNVAILAGTYLAVFLVGNLPVLFIAPGILAIALILVYAFIAKDELPDYELKKFSLLTIIGSFWTNPIKNPDFGLVWWSRFLITLATMMFTTYRLFYMQQHLGIEDEGAATAAIATGVLMYTIALMIAAAVSGWLSDKVKRRKPFVIGSTALFGIGLVMLAHADSVGHFYLAEIVMGLAYGVYTAVDTALVVDVLPNADRPGKDLGVVNIANALPQSLAPAFALIFLGIGVGDNSNFTAMLWAAGAVAFVGAAVILPVRKVR